MQEEKVKLHKKEKVVKLSWFGQKLYSISVLYLILSIVVVIGIALGIRYEVFADKTLVFHNAKASVKPVVFETEVQAKDCKEAIEKVAPKYGAPVDLMTRIMDSESGNDSKAANQGSTARGCFQFLFGTWEAYGQELWQEDYYEKSVYNPEHNAELAAWAITSFGTSDWDASKHSWGKQ